MDYKVSTQEFSFDALAEMLTGYVFTRGEFDSLARFLAPKDTPAQVMTDRGSKWIPWLLVQFPSFAQIDTTNLTSANSIAWLKTQKERFPGTFAVRAVHPQ